MTRLLVAFSWSLGWGPISEYAKAIDGVRLWTNIVMLVALVILLLFLVPAFVAELLELRHQKPAQPHLKHPVWRRKPAGSTAITK
jgi:hypothetical protein